MPALTAFRTTVSAKMTRRRTLPFLFYKNVAGLKLYYEYYYYFHFYLA